MHSIGRQNLADVTMPADDAAPFRNRPSQAYLVAAVDGFDRAAIRLGYSHVTHGLAERHRPGRGADDDTDRQGPGEPTCHARE